jgi:hypothetical protein
MCRRSLAERRVETRFLAYTICENALAVWLVAAILLAHLLCLQEHQGQPKTGVSPLVAMPTAYGVLEQRKVFQIFGTKPGEAKARGCALRTGHLGSP